MKMAKSFSGRIVERNVTVIRARPSSHYCGRKVYRPLWSSIFFFAMSTRLSVIPNLLLQMSWLWAVLDVVEVVVFHLPALVAIPRKTEVLRLAEETRNATDILLKCRRVWVMRDCSCLLLVHEAWRKRVDVYSIQQWRIPIQWIVRYSVIFVITTVVTVWFGPIVWSSTKLVYYAPALTKQAGRHSFAIALDISLSSLRLVYICRRRRYYTHYTAWYYGAM